MTSEDFMKYLRIVFYAVGGNIMGSAWTNGSNGQLTLSCILLVGTFVWSVYGNRLAAKVAEIAKIAKDPTTPIKGIITTDDAEGKALAQSTPGMIVSSGTPEAKIIAS